MSDVLGDVDGPMKDPGDAAGEGRLGQRTDAERADGDAELCAREHDGELTETARGAAGAGIALLDKTVEARSPRREQGELDGDEEAVEDEQDEGDAEGR